MSEIQIVGCCLSLSGLNERLLEVDLLFWRDGKKKEVLSWSDLGFFLNFI